MQRFSEKITDLLGRHAERGVTLEQVLDNLDRQGTGFLLVLLSLPLLVPLPPGVGTVGGILLLVWAGQRLFGVRVPWIPAFVRRKALSPETLRVLTEKGVPVLRKLERYSGGNAFLANELAVKVACLVVFAMALLLILPMPPFLNPLFAFVIMLMGVGLACFNMKLYLAGVAGGVVLSVVSVAGYSVVVREGVRFLFQ
jgi:hypothetical protein